MPLQISGPDGTYEVPDSYLAVGLDETGHHSMSDPDYPLFGLAGCAVRADAYRGAIANPWNAMKALHFGPPGTPLHASQLKATGPQSEALSGFFSSDQFARFAVVTTAPRRKAPGRNAYETLANGVIDALTGFVNVLGCTGVAAVAEESSEGDALLARAFRDRGFALRTSLGPVTLPFDRYRASKAVAEPLTEVADFVAHAAGCQVRNRLTQPESALRRDFQAVFQSISPELVFIRHVR